MIRIICLIAIFIGTSFGEATAQKYKSAAGLRMDGQLIGLTYSQRFFNRTTAELNVDLRSREARVSAIGKFHKPILGQSLTMFVGGGYHFGTYKDFGGFNGADLTLGIEHKIILLPFSIGFEINPSIHLAGNHPDWYTFQTVFSIKYVIRKDKEGYFSNSQQRQRQRNRRKRLKERLKSKYEE